LVILFGACTALRAEPPTAQFAAAQLELAQSELDEATGALRMQDYAQARQLAAQAHLDARLAWGMTESPFVRRGALEVARRADRLRAQGVLSASVGIHAAP
jgi:hypothetical protein